MCMQPEHRHELRGRRGSGPGTPYHMLQLARFLHLLTASLFQEGVEEGRDKGTSLKALEG